MVDDLGTMSSVFGSAFSVGKIAVPGIILIAAIGGLVWVVMRYSKYDTKVITLSMRKEGSFKVITDRGAYIKNKDGSQKFRLLRDRAIIAPPPYKFLHPAGKGNYLFLSKVNDSDYIPLDADVILKDKTGKLLLKTLDADVKFWLVQSLKQVTEKFRRETFIEKYGNYIIWALGIVAILLMLYLIFDGFGNVIAPLNRIASNLGKTAAGAAY